MAKSEIIALDQLQYVKQRKIGEEQMFQRGKKKKDKQKWEKYLKTNLPLYSFGERKFTFPL